MLLCRPVSDLSISLCNLIFVVQGLAAMQGRVTQIDGELDQQKAQNMNGGGDLGEMMRADNIGALKEELRELSEALGELLPQVQKEGGKAYICAMPGDRAALTNKQTEVSGQLANLQTKIAQVVMKATMMPSSSPRPALAAVGQAPATAAAVASPLAPSPGRNSGGSSLDTMSFIRQVAPEPEASAGASGFGFMNGPEMQAQQEQDKKEAEEQAKKEAEEAAKKAEQDKVNAAFGGFSVGGSDLDAFMNTGS
jgi:hypothetical protein